MASSMELRKNTRYAEYQAYRNEHLFMTGKRPSLAERREIWNDMQALYPDSQPRKNPFEGAQ
jgi:hypothetical protein